MSVLVRLVAGTLRGQRQYGVDFVGSIVLSALVTAGEFGVVVIILTRFPRIAGWSLPQLALLFGLSATATSVYRTLTDELHDFERYMVNGEFDAILLRPWPSLLVMLARGVNLGKLGGLLEGLGITAWGAARLGLAPSGWGWLLLFSVTGSALVLAIGIATSATAFWLERIGELQVFTLYAPSFAAEFPQSIYAGWLRALFLSAIPIAFVNYLPVRAMLGHGGGIATMLLPVPAAAISLTLAALLWSAGERRYRSTGS